MMDPGPNFAIVTSMAVGVSRRAGVMTGIGLAAASFTWASLASLGLSLISGNLAWIYEVIRIIGAGYLIWIGVRMIIDARRPPRTTATVPDLPDWAAARKGYFVSMTNPKAMAFYGSIFVTVVPAHAPTWFYVAVVAIAAAVSASWYCSVALLFSNNVVKNSYLRAKSVIEVTLGLFFIWFGCRLFLTR